MSVARLCEELQAAGQEVQVLTTTANGVSELDVIPGKLYHVDGVAVIYFKRITKDHSHFSPSLLGYLWKHGASYEVVHIHSWWNLVALGAALICYIKKFPFVVSPRGMFSDYSVSGRRSLMKRMIHALLNKPVLKHAHFHATTRREMDQVLELFPHASVQVAFNIVDLPAQKVYDRLEEGVYKLVFISRIDPKKGLPLLFQALQQVSFPFRLSVIGGGDPEYMMQLKQQTVQLGISENVTWSGVLQGDEKFDALGRHDLMVLPSYDENFGNVVVEALSAGVPVLLSEQVGLSSVVSEHQLGWVCSTEITSIREGLETSFREAAVRKNITREAPAWVRKVFSGSHLTGNYFAIYKRCITHA